MSETAVLPPKQVVYCGGKLAPMYNIYDLLTNIIIRSLQSSSRSRLGSTPARKHITEHGKLIEYTHTVL
jgi:hypothetical protein